MAVTSTPPNVYVHDDGQRTPPFGVSPDASWTLPTSIKPVTE